MGRLSLHANRAINIAEFAARFPRLGFCGKESYEQK